jgi:hypothetical protein
MTYVEKSSFSKNFSFSELILQDNVDSTHHIDRSLPTGGRLFQPPTLTRQAAPSEFADLNNDELYVLTSLAKQTLANHGSLHSSIKSHNITQII